MTHPEFTIEEESPRTPLLDEQKEEDLENVSKTWARVLPLDDEVTAQANTNNNAVDGTQEQIVASHLDSPLQNLETSV